MKTLSIKNISKSFKRRKVVDGLSFEVKESFITGLLGPNGAGKTTSFYMVVGFLKPDSGAVLLNGEDISALPMYKRAQLGVGYLPQNASIFRKLTVKENLIAAMEATNIAKQQRAGLLDELVERFGIKEILKSKGVSLSGGERRRVEIARALVPNPKFLLLDEPFAGIDPVTVQEIQQVIKELKEQGIGILITDHNVRETLGICDHAYILANGRLLATGSPDEVLNNQDVQSVYLGSNFQIE